MDNAWKPLFAVKRKIHRRVQAEASEQKVVAEWLDYHGVLWFHCPNGGHRSARVGAELKRQGVKRGVPDIIILDRPPLKPEYIGCVVELKAGAGRLTGDQLYWLYEFRQRQWLGVVTHGATETINRLVEFGYGLRR